MKSRTAALALVLASLLCACAAEEKKAGVDPLQMMEARLSSLEAQLQESRSSQDRLSGAIDALTHRLKEPAVSSLAPRKNPPRGNMKKTPQLPITRLTPEGGTPGDLAEEDEGREVAETVADSRHEGLHGYREALALLKERKFDEGVEDLRRFLKDYPDHVYADRAQFLIAEAHYSNKEYGLVVVAAKLLETKYPYSFRLPEVLYYRAMALLMMGQRPQATDALKDLVKRFPRETAAENASRKLAELAVKGRSLESVPLMPEVGT